MPKLIDSDTSSIQKDNNGGGKYIVLELLKI